MAELEKRVDRLYNWAFVSNGIMSADKRIVHNTNRIEVVENYPCKNGCIFEENEKEENEMQSRRRNFRIGDLANFIQLAVLALIVYGMFFQ